MQETRFTAAWVTWLLPFQLVACHATPPPPNRARRCGTLPSPSPSPYARRSRLIEDDLSAVSATCKQVTEELGVRVEADRVLEEQRRIKDAKDAHEMAVLREQVCAPLTLSAPHPLRHKHS